MSTDTGHDRPALLDGVRALSFDLDDTFWDCAPAIRHAEETLYGWFGREAPRITERHDPASLAERRIAIAAAHPEHTGDVTTMRRAVIGQLLREADYPASLVDPAFAIFLRARSEVVLYEGVPAMLERLAGRFRLAAITNGNADLGQIGLAHHFEVILAASAEIAPKPSPEMFHRCVDELGIGINELLHIGDNALTDVSGARDAGARALWFNRRRERWPETLPPEPASVESIEALVALLAPGDDPETAAENRP